MKEEREMAREEDAVRYGKQMDFVSAQNAAARKLAGEPIDIPGSWEAEGEVSVTGIGYVHVYGRFTLENPRRILTFNGDLVGDVLAGTSTHGKALFAVPLEELLAGSVLTVAVTYGLVAAACVLDWSRDLRHQGTYKGPGWGIFGGKAVGGGQFKLS
jgi:hypothetical protein